MDADISAAADALTLAKIKAQDYRNEVNQKYAAATKLAADTTAGYAALDAQEAAEFKRTLMVSAFEKFATPGTETDPVKVLADAQQDAARAKAHYDEFCKAFGIV